ncbi:transcription termination/antitermination protein NusA [bacterium]|nr:MAG: transcription termination/antitermination protein NusA [bacterium]
MWRAIVSQRGSGRIGDPLFVLSSNSGVFVFFSAQKTIEDMAIAKKVVKTEQETRSEMLDALKMVSEEKNIPVETLVESIEGALVSAYKRAFGGVGQVRIEADFARTDFRVYATKLVVQKVVNPNTEVAWRDAREQDRDVNLGDYMEREVTPAGFGRVAALTAKQVLMQKLREVERVQVASEYADKQGQLFRGTVSRLERGDVIMQVGKAEALLPRKEQALGESYRTGETFFVFVVDIRRDSALRGPALVVSRTHPGLLRNLFTREVPEIAEGIVELKAVAREAGQRSKIAVWAQNPDVDPVGACVGPRGNRVAKVVGELGMEKVDIVRWNADPAQFITNALSPARVLSVQLKEDRSAVGPGTATVIVSEDQQSLAIGKQGQNVRLAAKLTGWRIDVRTEKQFAEEQAKKMFSVGGPLSSSATVTSISSPLDSLFKLDGEDVAPIGTQSSAAVEDDATQTLFDVTGDDEEGEETRA